MSTDRRIEAIELHLQAIDRRLSDHHRHLIAILQNQETIMSAISDYAAASKLSFDAIKTGLDTLTTQIKALDDKIAELQNSPGAITPADQALLDQAQTMSAALATQATALAGQVQPPPTPPHAT